MFVKLRCDVSDKPGILHLIYNALKQRREKKIQTGQANIKTMLQDSDRMEEYQGQARKDRRG